MVTYVVFFYVILSSVGILNHFKVILIMNNNPSALQRDCGFNRLVSTQQQFITVFSLNCNHIYFEDTPASAKVAISLSIFRLASTKFMARAAPVPSPKRIFIINMGFIFKYSSMTL